MVHGRDHAPEEIHVYCPLFFHHVLCKAFGDKEIYSLLLLPPAQAVQFLRQLAHLTWLKPYSWGIRLSAPIPSSYVLLKRKKDYIGARPIISYHGFIFARLFTALAIVLHSLCKLVLPHSFGLASLPELFRSLHVFFDAAPRHDELRPGWIFYIHPGGPHPSSCGPMSFRSTNVDSKRMILTASPLICKRQTPPFGFSKVGLEKPP